jgi:hypothetical protein
MAARAKMRAEVQWLTEPPDDQPGWVLSDDGRAWTREDSAGNPWGVIRADTPTGHPDDA